MPTLGGWGWVDGVGDGDGRGEGWGGYLGAKTYNIVSILDQNLYQYHSGPNGSGRSYKITRLASVFLVWQIDSLSLFWFISFSMVKWDETWIYVGTRI